MSIPPVLPDDFTIDEAIKKDILKKIEVLSQLEDDFPVFVIHDIRDVSVVYMSPKGAERLGVTSEEIRNMGKEYYSRFFNSEDSENYLNNFLEFAANPENDQRWHTIFQQVKIPDAKDYLWFLCVTKVLTRDQQSGAPLLAMSIVLQLNAQLLLSPKLERLIAENNFLKENYQRFSQLTKRELEILKWMALGYNPAQIAGRLITSEQTVRTHRRNIKRKLGTKNDYELIRFAQSFNVI